MKVKVFNIRPHELYLEYDQQLVNEFLDSVEVIETAISFVNERVDYWSMIIQYDEKNEPEPQSENIEFERPSTIKTKYSRSHLNEEELEMAKKIKQWRDEKASEASLPVYMILSNADIYSAIKEMPIDFLELYSVYGFGRKKIEKYGKEIISMLHSEG